MAVQPEVGRDVALAARPGAEFALGDAGLGAYFVGEKDVRGDFRQRGGYSAAGAVAKFQYRIRRDSAALACADNPVGLAALQAQLLH